MASIISLPDFPLSALWGGNPMPATGSAPNAGSSELTQIPARKDPDQWPSYVTQSFLDSLLPFALFRSETKQSRRSTSLSVFFIEHGPGRLSGLAALPMAAVAAHAGHHEILVINGMAALAAGKGLGDQRGIAVRRRAQSSIAHARDSAQGARV